MKVYTFTTPDLRDFLEEFYKAMAAQNSAVLLHHFDDAMTGVLFGSEEEEEGLLEEYARESEL